MQALCLVACERPVVPPCGSKFVFQRVTARLCCFSSLRWKCANICRVGSFPTPFSRARVVCCFCNIVTYLCLRRCWMFTVHVTRHLNAMGLCFVCTCKLCSSRGCWHRGRLFGFYRTLWWRSGYFVSLTMGCAVVTEPFDLTTLVEDTRSLFQFGCTPILPASASQHGWAHSRFVVANGMLPRKNHTDSLTPSVREKKHGLL